MSRLPDALREQADNCVPLGSPFMGRLLNGLAANWPTDHPLAQRFEAWPGDIGPKGASLPLRLCGGLHALVISGQDKALAAAYPPNDVDDAHLIRAVLGAMDRHADFLNDWCDNAPQTNEIRRSAALIPTALTLVDRFNLPLCLSELGASGGLNLHFPEFALRIGDASFGPTSAPVTLAPEWTGPLPPWARLTVTDRRGTDLNPLNPKDTDGALRLIAYLWADQSDRLARTQAAIDLPHAPVDRMDAADWIEARMAQVRPGQIHMIYHTIAWQYFPDAVQTRARAAIEAAGAKATANAPVAWLSMENDGSDTKPGAALVLRLWPGDLTLQLGRAGFHGQWIDWAGTALDD